MCHQFILLHLFCNQMLGFLGLFFFLMTNKHDWYTFTIVNEHSIYIIYDIDLDAWP